MIRIAFISHLSEISGAGAALIATATGLDPQKFHGTLFLPGEGPLLHRAREAKLDAEVIRNPEVAIAGRSAPSKLELLRERRQYVRQLASVLRYGSFDVAYINTSMTVFPGLAARKAKVPILWHIHETIPKPTVNQRIKFGMIRRLAHGFLFASESGLAAFKPPRSKPSMVAKNALDLATIANSTRDAGLEAKLGIVPSDFIIVANGVNPAKGPDVLMNALVTIRINSTRIPVKVVLVGVPSGEHAAAYADLVKRAEQLSLGKSLVFAGFLNNLPSLLRRANLIVSPSRSESLPMFLLEGMALKVPVIATSVGDCPRLLANGDFGLLIPPDDARELTTAIMRVYDCYDEAKYRSEAAQKHVIREYASANVWQPLESFIETIAGKR